MHVCFDVYGEIACGARAAAETPGATQFRRFTAATLQQLTNEPGRQVMAPIGPELIGSFVCTVKDARDQHGA